MCKSRVAFTFLLAVLILTSTAHTTDAVDISASDDACIRMDEPDANYGASELLLVRNRYGHSTGSDDFEYDTLVQFLLSEVQYGCDVVSATLHVYYDDHGSTDPAGRTLTCHRVMAAWNENDITWTSQPAFESVPTAAITVPGSTGQWLSFDVTADLDYLTDPHGLYGWVIRDTTKWGDVSIPLVMLLSKEHSEFAPHLEIEASGSADYVVTILEDASSPHREEWDYGLQSQDIVPDSPTPLVGETVTIMVNVHNYALCQARAAHGWYSPIGRSCWGEWDFLYPTSQTIDISCRCRDNYDVDWRFELDGLHLATTTVPGLGDTNTWRVVTIADVPIAAGPHRIFMGTYQMDYDPDYFLDWIQVGDVRIEAENYDRSGGNNPDHNRQGLTIEPRASDPPDSARITVQLWEGEPGNGGVLLIDDFVGDTNIVADVHDEYDENWFEAHYIPSNGVGIISCEWTPQRAGPHDFYVVVDPESLLLEINEQNNVAHATFTAVLPDYSISQNFPNPVAGQTGLTQITYSIPTDADVSLILYNLSGEFVQVLISGTRSAGSHTVSWDGKDSSGEGVGSGIYFYHFKADDYEARKKLVLMK